METQQPNIGLTAIIVAGGSVEALQRSLATASAIADEILVLATALTPERDQLQLSQGMRLIESPHLDHRGNLRNAALEHARGGWILWLEAGEVLDADGQEALVDFLREAADPQFAYWTFIVSPTEHGNLAGEQSAQIRLHPHREDLFFTGRVRESLLPAMTQNGMQVEGLSLSFRRVAEDTPSFMLRSAAQNEKELAELALQECGPTAEVLNCLGETSQKLGEWEESEKYYRQALAAAEKKSTAALEAYYGLLATLDAGGANRQQQLRLCMEAIEMFPLDAQLLCALGGYLQSLGHLELAARSYDVAVNHGRVEPLVTHLANIVELAAASQADVHFQAEQWAAANKAVSAGLTLFPESQRLLRQQLQLAVRRRDEQAALEVAHQIEVEPQFRETLNSAVHGALAATDGSLTLARAQLESAWRAGWRDVLCCQWLAEVQLAQEAWSDAQVTLDAWHQLQPRAAELHRLRQRWLAACGKPATAVSHDYDYDVISYDGSQKSAVASTNPDTAASAPLRRLDPAAKKTSPPLAPLAQKLAAVRAAKK